MPIPTLGEFPTLGRGFSEFPLGVGSGPGVLAPTIQNSSIVTNWSVSSSNSITLGTYTTVAGDCIVCAVIVNGSTTVSGSGAGATWVTVATSGTTAALVIGYNCSAGQTSFTLNLGAADNNAFVVCVFSGALAASSPIGTPQTNTGTTISTLTTPTVNYPTGSVVVGVRTSGLIVGDFNTEAWSNGATNHQVGAEAFNSASPSVGLDYIINPTAGSTTYNFTTTASATLNAIAVSVVG